jgi:molecular chaperone DnaK
MDKQIVSKAVGIDLGTTNSAVAVMNQMDTDIIIHKDKIARRETTPSCVWKDPRTGDIVVGHKAFIRIGTSPSPIRSIKRLMGQQTKVMLTNEEVTPEQVSSYVLKEMKKQIEEDVKAFSTDATEWVVDRAIITVPAYFDQPQIEATRKAGEMTGLEVVEILHEPTASACYYCWKNKVQNGVFLVYDLGGGTFDVTVLRCTEGAFEVLGISGNRFLGGDDMDKVIAEDLQGRLLKEGYALELDVRKDPEDSLRFDKLKFLAEGVKKALSPPDVGEYYLRDTGSLKDKEGLPVTIETMYTKPELEALIRPIVDRTISYCFDALDDSRKKAGVKLSDVDAVILAGGPAHIPLVREIVRHHLCSPASDSVVDERALQPRAKCTELVYDKVDTVVALGAAIRASASGGLAVSTPEKTVRVIFRGMGVTNARDSNMGGQVVALDPGIDIVGGHIRLILPDHNYEDESDIKEGGTFAFKQIPLQDAAENLLTFEVYDRTGKLVASAGRQVKHTTEEVRPMGEGTETSVLSKAIHVEVLKEGKPVKKELIAALTTIPVSQKYTFSHPGNTEMIVLPIYQHKRKIQDIKVKVPSSLPKGTLIEMDIYVDKLSIITVTGKVGDISFDAKVEPPQDRGLPTEEEVKALDNAFREALTYLPSGNKSVAEAKYKKAKLNFVASAKRGDISQAVNDFEEMEELVAEISRTSGPMQPPKEFFDELVEECLEINELAAEAAAEGGKPHDHREFARAIEAQRQQGERAYKAADQKAYAECMLMLENYRNHLIGLYRKIAKPKDDRTDDEKASANVQYAEGEASKLSQLAAGQGRNDLQGEIDQILGKLKDLSKEARKDPRKVQEAVSKLRGRLEQIKNILMGKADDKSEKLVEDHSF